MKILLICNDSNNVINFRSELIKEMIDLGFGVAVITSDELRLQEVNALGVSSYVVKYKNRSINLFKIANIQKQFKRIIREYSPDCVFTFQIKPNIFGVRAARKCGIKRIYSMVEGLGDPFSDNGCKNKILKHVISFMYKKACKYARRVFFLNLDDINEFVKSKIIDRDKCILIPGIGIDNKNYMPAPLPSNLNVVAMARLIVNKGILDYCNVARLVKKKRNDINFYLYGEESQLRIKDIKEYIDEGSIIYCGYTTNAKDAISNCRLLVSCSFYREGFPRTILESMALERVTIASNSIGNKDAVVNGVTGFLITPHDINGFAEAILNIIDNDEKLVRMGKEAKRICKERYDSSLINEKIINIICEANDE